MTHKGQRMSLGDLNLCGKYEILLFYHLTNPPPLGFLPETGTKLRNRYGTARKRRRPYRTAFPDLETPYGTAGGVSWPYRPVRPAFRASLRRNKKKKGGHGAPKQSNIYFFCIFYVFLASLLHFFCIIMFFLQYNVLFLKKLYIHIYIF
jgi:hypothetical protein